MTPLNPSHLNPPDERPLSNATAEKEGEPGLWWSPAGQAPSRVRVLAVRAGAAAMSKRAKHHRREGDAAATAKLSAWAARQQELAKRCALGYHGPGGDGGDGDSLGHSVGWLGPLAVSTS